MAYEPARFWGQVHRVPYFLLSECACVSFPVIEDVHVRTDQPGLLRALKTNLVMYRLCSWEINYGVYPWVAILSFLRGNCPTVLLYTWQADSASCSQGLSSVANAQKVAASTLFLCLYRYSNSAAHDICPR